MKPCCIIFQISIVCQVTACCCLFLAGKVEETPKKCKDIIKIAREKLSDEKFRQFGDDPKVGLVFIYVFMNVWQHEIWSSSTSCVYKNACLFQEEVMTLERILLQTIKFDLQVEHPYGFLLKYAKSLRGNVCWIF